MQRTIKHSWFFAHSPEVVWKYLTKPELIAEWLMENDFKPVVGHQFQFRAKPKIKFGFDGIIYCEVLEVIPCKRLSYSWLGGAGIEKITLHSVVTWTLTSKEGGTELLLEHRGFKGMRNYLAYLIMNKGWMKIGKRLAKRINISKNETTNA
jgi:uncharacterized protein YndB with AHSA1/START domain